jgi:carboxypeptidase C (cathepsin A)
LLEWKYSKEFSTAERFIWKVSKNDREIAGYAKSAGNFTQVVVRNGGHCTIYDQPRAAFDMIKRFIKSQTFDREYE